MKKVVKKTLEILIKRPQDFYNKKSYIKTLIFPEGTLTNGKYLANFKRGCFISLIVLSYDGFICLTNRFLFLY